MYKEDKDYLISGRVLNEIDKIMNDNGIVSGYSVGEIAESIGEDVDEVLLAYLLKDWESDENIKDMMCKLGTDVDGVLEYITREHGDEAYSDVSESLVGVLHDINCGVL